MKRANRRRVHPKIWDGRKMTRQCIPNFWCDRRKRSRGCHGGFAQRNTYRQGWRRAEYSHKHATIMLQLYTIKSFVIYTYLYFVCCRLLNAMYNKAVIVRQEIDRHKSSPSVVVPLSRTVVVNFCCHIFVVLCHIVVSTRPSRSDARGRAQLLRSSANCRIDAATVVVTIDVLVFMLY